LFFSIAGCASLGTYNPATGRSELIFISTPEEVALGNDIHKQLDQQYKSSTKREHIDKINRIGRRLAQVSDRRDYTYQFFVIEQDDLNAFTVPGGRVYIFSGLIDKLETEDQIASVLAHEIGHCAARHTIKKFQAALGYNLISSIVLGQVGGPQAQEVASMSSNMIMSIVFSAYGRQDEYEADRLGVKYLHAAGYDPAASVESLEILARETQDGGAPLILRSHPYLADRIKTTRKEVELLSKP
jgi:predicted Zn-dependent protease